MPEKIDISLLLTTQKGLPESDLLAVQQRVREVVAEQLDALVVDEDAGINRLVGALLAIDRLEDTRLLAAQDSSATNLIDLPAGVLKLAGKPNTLGKLTLVDTNLPTQVQIRIRYGSEETPPSEQDVSRPLETLLKALETPPTGARSAAYTDLLAVLPLTGIDQTANPVRLLVVRPGGLTQRLDQAGDTYRLTDHERLVVGEITFEEAS